MPRLTKAELRAKLAEAEKERDDNLTLAMSHEVENGRLKAALRRAETERDKAVEMADVQMRRANELHADMANQGRLARDTLSGVVEIFRKEEPPRPIKLPF